MRRVLLWGLLFLFVLFLKPDYVKADVYDNAYTFYQTYENEMVFKSGENNQGEIYYATKAKKDSSAGIRYVTLGWKVRLLNGDGSLIETLYYQLGGLNMVEINTCDKAGYEYHLYCVTLENLKQRMSESARTALSQPGCNIIFDACTTTMINGKVQGAMTDQGESWGRVYDTYNGIVNAQNWSVATKESLKSYYNKNVKGIFYEVKLDKSEGIIETSGAGKYLFGTVVTIDAMIADGYHFSSWNGSATSEKKTYTFVVYGEDISLKANAKQNTYFLKYDAAGGVGNISMSEVSYFDVVTLPCDGFEKNESKLKGWEIPNRDTCRFSTGQTLRIMDLVHQLQLEKESGVTITLYAVWDSGPLIIANDIYASLSDAQSGCITEWWIANNAEVVDAEDGVIPYGRAEKSYFLLQDYKETDFTSFKSEGMVTQTFLACDSSGNIAKKRIKIYIVDTKIYDATEFNGKVRFISARYFKDNQGNLVTEKDGGLWETSLWRLDEEYLGVLDQLFSLKN